MKLAPRRGRVDGLGLGQGAGSTFLALLLGLGCSGSGDGERPGGSGSSGSGGSDAQGGAPAGGSGAATSCGTTDAFSGPQLRDCDLPGVCGRCLWEKACDQFLFQCARDAGCVCMAECIGSTGVGGADGCLEPCGLTSPPPGFSQFLKLAADMCWDEGCGRLGESPPEPSGSTSGGSLGSGTEADCAFDPGLAYDPCGPVLQLQSSDGSICVRIERRDEGPGTDANTAWTLLDVRVGPLGEVCHTSDPSNLCWFSSHHNYADWASRAAIGTTTWTSGTTAARRTRI
jgi:hypothetical protein